MYVRKSVRKRKGRYSLFKNRYYLLSLMIIGIEFHFKVPSYIKLFFMLLEGGLGKRNVFELSRRLCCSDTFSKFDNFSRDGVAPYNKKI